MRFRPFLIPALFAIAAGCGHSEEEWQAQLAKYDQLSQQHQQTQDKLTKTAQELEAEKARVADLEAKLKAMGLSLEETTGKVSKLSASLEEQEKALKQYKERAALLEAMKARFEALKKK